MPTGGPLRVACPGTQRRGEAAGSTGEGVEGPGGFPGEPPAPWAALRPHGAAVRAPRPIRLPLQEAAEKQPLRMLLSPPLPEDETAIPPAEPGLGEAVTAATAGR